MIRLLVAGVFLGVALAAGVVVAAINTIARETWPEF